MRKKEMYQMCGTNLVHQNSHEFQVLLQEFPWRISDLQTDRNH